MKVLKIIKWFAFVVCILSLAVCAVGNTFVYLDAKDNADVMVKDIKASVQALNPLKNLFGSGDKDANKTDPDDDANEPDGTVDAEAGDIIPSTTQPSVPDPETPGDEAIDSVPEKMDDVQPGVYTPDHNNIVLAFMKYGTTTSSLDFLSNTLGIKGVNPIAKCVANGLENFTDSDGESLLTSYKFTESPLGLQAHVNVSLFISFVALFIAFLLQVITKKYKTVYGILLMIVSYLFFAGLFAVGYYFSDCIMSALTPTFAGIDFELCRMFFNAGVMLLALLISVPLYSCGMRQIKIHYLKRRLRKKRFA